METISSASLLQQIVGDELMRVICDQLGGQHVYIPYTMPFRDAQIAAEFNTVIHQAASVGSAYAQVGETFGVSPRTVRRVIAGN